MTPEGKESRLRSSIRKMGRVLVAFSGGADSTYLLAVSLDVLGPEHVLAITASSPSLARREKASCERLAHLLGAPHRWIHTRELDIPAYAANPSDRCYFCKTDLFRRLVRIASVEHRTLVDGTNTSDRSEVRPGAQAGRDHGVRHPLDKAGLNKEDIRTLSRAQGIPTWDKPASPCLSSRIPFGTPITREALRTIESAEEALQDLGLRVLRVRHHGETARIVLGKSEHRMLRDRPGLHNSILAAVKAAGYRSALIDPQPYQNPAERTRPPNLTVWGKNSILLRLKNPRTPLRSTP